MSDLQGHTTSNPCNLAQFAALAALDPVNDSFVEDVRAVLGERRECALAIARPRQTTKPGYAERVDARRKEGQQ